MSNQAKDSPMQTQHLESLGHLCASLQAPYARVRRAVDALGIEPAVTINGVPHFDEQQCDCIAREIKSHKETK